MTLKYSDLVKWEKSGKLVLRDWEASDDDLGFIGPLEKKYGGRARLVHRGPSAVPVLLLERPLHRAVLGRRDGQRGSSRHGGLGGRGDGCLDHAPGEVRSVEAPFECASVEGIEPQGG
jgi:hypothetical protein